MQQEATAAEPVVPDQATIAAVRPAARKQDATAEELAVHNGVAITAPGPTARAQDVVTAADPAPASPPDVCADVKAAMMSVTGKPLGDDRILLDVLRVALDTGGDVTSLCNFFAEYRNRGFQSNGVFLKLVREDYAAFLAKPRKARRGKPDPHCPDCEGSGYVRLDVDDCSGAAHCYCIETDPTSRKKTQEFIRSLQAEQQKAEAQGHSHPPQPSRVPETSGGSETPSKEPAPGSRSDSRHIPRGQMRSVAQDVSDCVQNALGLRTPVEPRQPEELYPAEQEGNRQVSRPVCPKCKQPPGRGLIAEGHQLLPCPACSTPEWVAEVKAKLDAVAENPKPVSPQGNRRQGS